MVPTGHTTAICFRFYYKKYWITATNTKLFTYLIIFLDFKMLHKTKLHGMDLQEIFNLRIWSVWKEFELLKYFKSTSYILYRKSHPKNVQMKSQQFYILEENIAFSRDPKSEIFGILFWVLNTSVMQFFTSILVFSTSPCFPGWLNYLY